MNKDIIKNKVELATSDARRDVLQITEAGLRAIDTETVLKNAIELDGSIMRVAGTRFDLKQYNKTYVIGFGKVACTAAYTLEQILANKITEGAVVGLAERVCQVVDTYAGTHPIPSQQNYTATKHIEEVARRAKENDLVIVVVSGGGSALLCSSMGECDQGKKLFDAFLQSGGTIEELNTVRKHISKLKGGGLAEALYPATVIGLIFSDVPGGDLSAVASGPTYYDESTVADAQVLIDQYDLGDFHLNETPKNLELFKRVHNIPIVSNMTALNAMQAAAHTMGYQADIVSATHYATPEETASLITKNAPAGSVRLMGGETKVTVPAGCTGKGGRNDYLALTMLDSVTEFQVFASVASDGHDNTPAAGAIADRQTSVRATELQMTISGHLEGLNSYPFFDTLDDHIMTGSLDSNVSDLMMLLSPKQAKTSAGIADITATVINDSRGKKTVAVTVTADGYTSTFSVPSGASTGIKEVVVVPAAAAVTIIKNTVKPALLGMDVTDQAGIDGVLKKLGGDTSLAAIGGNVALGVSVAACKTAAKVQGQETWEYIADLFGHQKQAVAPRLYVNLINGGAHASVGSAIQEHQIIPDTDDVHLAHSLAQQVQQKLEQLLRKDFKKKHISVGDEGGFVIPADGIDQSFAYVQAAIEAVETDVPILLGADMAASSFYCDGEYELDGKQLTAGQLQTRYRALHKMFPLLQHVEDPFAEHDFAAFAKYQAQQPLVTCIGDDLTTTNVRMLQKAITAGALSGIIIKPNQIGTVTDTLATMQLAYTHHVRCIVSHRSGETMDDFIADLAYGTKSYGLKTGAPNMKERQVKYDRLLAIIPTHD
jgi:phosphopyruvate hydratase